MRVLDYNHYTYTSVYIVKFMYVGERNEDLRASMDVCVCVFGCAYDECDFNPLFD